MYARCEMRNGECSNVCTHTHQMHACIPIKSIRRGEGAIVVDDERTHSVASEISCSAFSRLLNKLFGYCMDHFASIRRQWGLSAHRRPTRHESSLIFRRRRTYITSNIRFFKFTHQRAESLVIHFGPHTRRTDASTPILIE